MLTLGERLTLLCFRARYLARIARNLFRSRASIERETRMLEEALHILKAHEPNLPPMTKLERLQLKQARKHRRK